MVFALRVACFAKSLLHCAESFFKEYKMKAVGYQQSLPIDDANSLIDIELLKPEASGFDLLVKVDAVSVNPIDTKMRMRSTPPEGDYAVLGWDAVGIVEAVGEQVSGFAPGDRVWYAGELTRPGTNSEYHLVDARIVGKAPTCLNDEAAAAMPLTALTAWEMLFDRFKLNADSTGTLLIVGAAGGVGSIMIQLAKKLTKLKVIGTASRSESKNWILQLGADGVIDHRKDFVSELNAIGVASVDWVASLTHTVEHMPQIVNALTPQGALGIIDDAEVLDIMPLKRKSISIHWELMYTRSLFKTADMAVQGEILNKVAALIDAGKLVSTHNDTFGKINASNLKRAHALLEAGQSRGKIVLAGF